MNIPCKFICKADVTLRPLARVQLQERYHRVTHYFAAPGNAPEFKSGTKQHRTKATYFTLLRTTRTSTEQRPPPSTPAAGFLAVCRANKAAAAVAPSLRDAHRSAAELRAELE